MDRSAQRCVQLYTLILEEKAALNCEDTVVDDNGNIVKEDTQVVSEGDDAPVSPGAATAEDATGGLVEKLAERDGVAGMDIHMPIPSLNMVAGRVGHKQSMQEVGAVGMEGSPEEEEANERAARGEQETGTPDAMLYAGVDRPVQQSSNLEIGSEDDEKVSC